MDGRPFQNPHGWRNKLMRVAWSVVWAVLFRPRPKTMHGWRRLPRWKQLARGALWPSRIKSIWPEYLHPQSEVLPLTMSAWAGFLKGRMTHEAHRENILRLDRDAVLPRFEMSYIAARRQHPR
jgi:hypothetical protein